MHFRRASPSSMRY